MFCPKCNTMMVATSVIIDESDNDNTINYGCLGALLGGWTGAVIGGWIGHQKDKANKKTVPAYQCPSCNNILIEAERN